MVFGLQILSPYVCSAAIHLHISSFEKPSSEGDPESFRVRYGPLRNESHLLENPIHPDNVSKVGIHLPRLTCRI